MESSGRYVNTLDRRYRPDRDLWALLVGWLASTLGFAVSIPFISIYFSAQDGLSIGEIGLFFGLLAVVRAVFQVIGGELSDRLKRRKLVIGAQLFRAWVFFMLAAAVGLRWGFWWTAFCLVLGSAAGAIFQPAANAVVSDILPGDRKLHGYALMRTAGNFGWAAGPALGGFLAALSYSLLFSASGFITILSALTLWAFLKAPESRSHRKRRPLADVVAMRDDSNMLVHSVLTFLLYLVVAQLIAPFSVYAVQVVGISQGQLGLLYTLNGLLVVMLQIPMTRLLSRYPLTSQMAVGGLLYAVGYGMIGILVGFGCFALAMVVITLGEMSMSPASLTLTSSMAPKGRTGQYMGIFGFVTTSGWSLGPVYGGFILDHTGHHPALAWILISSVGLLSSFGYVFFGRKIYDPGAKP